MDCFHPDSFIMAVGASGMSFHLPWSFGERVRSLHRQMDEMEKDPHPRFADPPPPFATLTREGYCSSIFLLTDPDGILVAQAT